MMINKTVVDAVNALRATVNDPQYNFVCFTNLGGETYYFSVYHSGTAICTIEQFNKCAFDMSANKF